MHDSMCNIDKTPRANRAPHATVPGLRTIGHAQPWHVPQNWPQADVGLDEALRTRYASDMDIRPITPDYSVSPQIAPEDIPAIAAAGYTTILCNRPDVEVPPGLQADAIRQAAEAAGLVFVINPVTHQGLNDDIVALQSATIQDSDGPVLAYCASGTRCTIVWGLGQAEQMPADTIIEKAAKAGYDLSGMKDRLTS